MNWYIFIKTAMPYSDPMASPICPHCTTSFIVDFRHEKGPKWANAPYEIARCPACNKPMKITGFKSKDSGALSNVSAEPMTTHEFRDAIRSGVPEAAVGVESETQGGLMILGKPIKILDKSTDIKTASHGMTFRGDGYIAEVDQYSNKGPLFIVKLHDGKEHRCYFDLLTGNWKILF